MASNEEIRAALERAADVFGRKPSAALSTARASGRVGDGLACEASQGRHTARMDMPVSMGGMGSAPTPGFYIRMGLVGCIAIGIKLTAAREGVDIGAVDVGIEMDFDDSALLGLGENSAAPLETRVTISVQSDAPRDTVAAMVDKALERDTFFLALRDAQTVTTRLVQAEA